MIDFKSPLEFSFRELEILMRLFNDCADCEWLEDQTDGEITLCNECEEELLELERNRKND